MAGAGDADTEQARMRDLDTAANEAQQAMWAALYQLECRSTAGGRPTRGPTRIALDKVLEARS